MSTVELTIVWPGGEQYVQHQPASWPVPRRGDWLAVPGMPESRVSRVRWHYEPDMAPTVTIELEED